MKSSETENHDECCSIDNNANQSASSSNQQETKLFRPYYIPVLSFILLLAGLSFEYLFKFHFFTGWVKPLFYLIAYLPVAYPVFHDAFRALKKGSLFTEFFLMSIASIGAFLIGEYPEGVAVMLFYSVGELLQSAAVKKARGNITALLDVRPKIANVFRDGKFITVNPETVEIGEKIQVKVGEKIPLDGILLSDHAYLDSSALTGESKPDSLVTGDSVMAGSINLSQVIELKSEKLFSDSSVAKILELVQNASTRKAKTELLIRKLASIYTPLVTYLAIGITLLPYLFVENYIFYDWFYRALIFLVISCPCALVISIPLGYFGGLGAASRNGILFKGASFMDLFTKVKTLVIDKTGTLTKGVFLIKDIIIRNGMDEPTFMKYVLSIEDKSTHPIAKAIMAYDGNAELFNTSDVKEFPGIGLLGEVNGTQVLAGNEKLLEQFKIEIPQELNDIIETVIIIAIDDQFAGYITISDQVKDNVAETIEGIRKLGIDNLVMLSGDKNSITQKLAKSLKLNMALGGLLPEDKLNKVLDIKKASNQPVAFIGDGINDAPVLAASDIGIAMGSMGSDLAIETADVVLQTDEPYKFITAVKISKSTQKVIWQNISLAFGVKAVVLGLGAIGLATMWAAVFADVGVALLAILNAVRLQKMKWSKF